MAKFERRLFAIGTLLASDDYNAEELLRALGDPGSCHAALGLQEQFVSAWWWLMGSAILKNDDELVEKIGGQTLDAILERHWVRNRFTTSSVELMALLLIDSALARKAGMQRFKMTADDDSAMQSMILNSIFEYPREMLDLLIDEGLPNGVCRHIRVYGDPAHVDARMTYSALLCLALIGHRASSGHSDSYLPDIAEMREIIKSSLPPDIRESLRRLLLLCYCPRQKCFAGSPGGEPHAGYVFCVAAALSLLESAEDGPQQDEYREKAAETISWLSCRLPDAQIPENSDCIGLRTDISRWSGSMNLCNGRPGKDGDVCYCFWVLAALRVLGAGPLSSELQAKIRSGLQAASTTELVFAKAPLDQAGMTPDIFHTYFGQLASRIVDNAEVDIYFGAPTNFDVTNTLISREGSGCE